jgi:hypothetical protein
MCPCSCFPQRACLSTTWPGRAQGDPRWALADPICTFLFAVLVLLTTRAILRDISDVLMERVPRAHDSAAMEAALLRVRPAGQQPRRAGEQCGMQHMRGRRSAPPLRSLGVHAQRRCVSGGCLHRIALPCACTREARPPWVASVSMQGHALIGKCGCPLPVPAERRSCVQHVISFCTWAPDTLSPAYPHLSALAGSRARAGRAGGRCRAWTA